MADTNSCPDPANLQALMEGTLPDVQQAELTDHLEHCGSCQDTVEQLAASPIDWAIAARHLHYRQEPVEALLHQVVNEDPTPSIRGTTPVDELPLDFLKPAAKPGQLGRLGHYEVLEVIGRGGMGVVLKALDQSLQRVVAIKVMAPQLAANARARKRFVREAQAAAAVRNDHVIDIHAVEEPEGLPYLVMEYIAGVSLQERLDQSGPLELERILRIGMQMATGLAAAHAQGLVHRDIKPANVLLENHVERVKITDFGLARAVDDTSLSQSGVVAGTPEYMAPEQARGEPVDHRTDLFSLGSVLYALCTGRPPFRASGTMAVLKRVCEDTPPPIQELNPAVPDWLVALIAKLHATSPSERFQSAAEVAELLAQGLAHLQQPALVARPLSPAQPAVSPKTARPTGRRWVVATVGLLLLIGGFVLTETTGGTKITAHLAAVLGMRAPADGREVQVDARPAPTPSLQVKLRATLQGHVAQINSVAFAPDGRTLATGSNDQTVKVWDLATGNERATLTGHTRVVTSVAFAPDGKTLASASWDGTIKLWHLATGKELERSLQHTGSIWSVAFAPDGKLVASGGDDESVKLWNAETGQEHDTFAARGGIRSLAFAPDGKTLAVTLHHARLRNVQLWDVDTRQLRATLEGHLTGCSCVAFTSDSQTLATGSHDRTVKLWHVATGEELATLQGHTKLVEAVAVSPDGKTLASADAIWNSPERPGDVRLWDLVTRKELAALREHQGGVFAVAFSPEGKTLATASSDGTVKLWDVSRPVLPAPEAIRELRRFEGHKAPVRGVALSFDVNSGQELHRITPGVVFSIAFAPDGRRARTAGEGVRLWRLPAASP